MKLMSLLAALLCVVGCCLNAVAETATNAVALPRSIFSDDPQKGRDPFFPDSVRRHHAVAPHAATSSPKAQVPASIFFLKGIYVSKNKPLALINNATVGAGELAEIRTGMQVVKIRCREIRERSVVVEIDGTGEIRELKLRDGF